MTDRGVSDVLGFVLVFSLITLSAVTVIALGAGGLETARDVEQVSNAERALDVLAENIDDVAVRNAPSRGTEMRLADGQLAFGESRSMAVHAIRTDADGNTTREIIEEASMQPLVYRAGDTQLVYEGTAVFRQEGGTAVTLREPAIAGNSASTVIPLVETEGSGGVGGSRTVLIRTDQVDRETVVVRDADQVRIRVSTDERRLGAWEGSLEEATPGTDACSRSGGAVTCTFETDVVSLTETGVEVTFE